MSPVTYTYLVDHAIEIRLVMALLAVVAVFPAVKLALIVDDVVKALRAKFAKSESGRRFAIHLDPLGNC